MLPDGSYDALVFDASDAATGADGGPGVIVELTILAGEHKGEVVSLRADALAGDPIELLGVPATITVRGGEPSVRFDR